MIGCTGAPPACGDDPTCGRPPLGVPCKHGGVFVRGPTGPKVDLVQRYVRLDDWHMAYREERVVSPGVPLVLVHGLGMSSRSFEWLMPHLVDDFHVVAVDLPGCGLSEYPPGDLDIAALVTALGDWLDGIDMPTADLVGHSLGGQVVLQLAAQRPDRVRHAVLVAATPDPAFTAVQKAARLLLDGLREPFAFVRVAVGDYLRAHPGRMWRTLRSALVDDLPRAAQCVDAAVLVVRGTRDPIITQEWADELGHLLPNSTIATIPGGTHGLPAQSPQHLARVLRDFLLPSAP